MKYIGHEWECFDLPQHVIGNLHAHMKCENTLPTTGNVYLVLISSPSFKCRKLVYIGSTKNLKKRISSHTIVGALKLNAAGCSIRIMYRNFKKNHFHEQWLIHIHKPIFNYNRKLRQLLFWKSLGVTELRKAKNRTINIGKQIELLRKKKQPKRLFWVN